MASNIDLNKNIDIYLKKKFHFFQKSDVYKPFYNKKLPKYNNVVV